MEFKDDFDKSEHLERKMEKPGKQKVEGPGVTDSLAESKELGQSKLRETSQESLTRSKKVKMEHRTAEWQSNYVSALSEYDKTQYGTIIARNKRLRDEMKVIVVALENIIVNEK